MNDLHSGRHILWFCRDYPERDNPDVDTYFVVYEDLFAAREGFVWNVREHNLAPRDIKAAIFTIAALRTLEPSTPWCNIPNELLFHIFGFL